MRPAVNDGGSVSVLMLALLAIVGLLCLATADAANVLLARSRAQTAADAAALVAASAQWRVAAGKEDPASAARAMASFDGAELVSCTCAIRADHATVVVSIATHIRMLLVAPRKVQATATARLDLNRVFSP